MGTPVTITDNAGATITLDGNGNITITCKNFNVVAAPNLSPPATHPATYELIGF